MCRDRSGTRPRSTAGSRTGFVAHWNLEPWNDHGDDWNDRGTEKAAHTIAYALTLDGPTENPNVLQFVCGYEILTDQTLPNISLVSC